MLCSATPEIGQAPTDRSVLQTPTMCVVDPQAADYQDWRNSADVKGLRLYVVGTAEEALRLSRQQPIELWVVNVELPGRSGFELCSMLKAQAAHARVYLVTDHYTPEVERRALLARATMFGCKGEHTGWLDAWLETVTRSAAAVADLNPKSEI